MIALSLSICLWGSSTSISHHIHTQKEGFPSLIPLIVHVNTKRSTHHISDSRFRWIRIVHHFSAHIYALFHLHGVTYALWYQKICSNTLRDSFPSPDILRNRVQLGRAAGLSRHSKELKRQKGREEVPDRATHTQNLTLIINYGCFCLILPQPVTTQLLAVKDSERKREGKAIFIKKRIISQNK